MHRPMDLRACAAAGAGGGRAGCAPADWPLLAAASAIAAEARAAVKVGPQRVVICFPDAKLCLSSNECDTRPHQAPALLKSQSDVMLQNAGHLPLLSPSRRVHEQAGQAGRWGHISVPTEQSPVSSFLLVKPAACGAAGGGGLPLFDRRGEQPHAGQAGCWGQLHIFSHPHKHMGFGAAGGGGLPLFDRRGEQPHAGQAGCWGQLHIFSHPHKHMGFGAAGGGGLPLFGRRGEQPHAGQAGCQGNCSNSPQVLNILYLAPQVEAGYRSSAGVASNRMLAKLAAGGSCTYSPILTNTWVGEYVQLPPAASLASMRLLATPVEER